MGIEELGLGKWVFGVFVFVFGFVFDFAFYCVFVFVFVSFVYFVWFV